MVQATNRNAAVHVNLRAIAHNVKKTVEQMPAGTEMFAVVKANGYGHGAVPVARVARENGATGFCVAVLDEALELRENGLNLPILVLGITSPSLAAVAQENDVSLSVGSLDWLKDAKEVLVAAKAENDSDTNIAPLKIHLAIDSGMGRIGFIEDADFVKANAFLNKNQEFFEVEGIYTHFASADSADETYFNYQVKRFNHLHDLLTVKPKYTHVANSATSLFHEACHSDLIRFGIGIYGLNPSSTPMSADLPLPYELEPALSLTSELVFVKQNHPGMGVSYGSTYVSQEDEWIGTVPLGYADGWLRRMQGFKVRVGDEMCEIIGRVCMDQFMVKLPREMPVGTEVELITADAKAPNSVKAVADYADTIHYEIACLLKERLPRVYEK